MPRNKQPKVAFVWSGGASLGAIQVGMLRALYEREITPDLIVGTSAGAFNGAYIASRPQTTATAESLARIWRGLRRAQVFPVNPVTGLLGFLGTRDHLVPESGLQRLIYTLRRMRRARGDAHPAARRRGGRGNRPRTSSFARPGT
jgi:NTE family protein